MHSLVFKTLSTAIPHAVETGFNWIKSWIEDDPKLTSKSYPTIKPRISITPRKKHDHAPITAEQHDEIIRMKDDLDFVNGLRLTGSRKTTQDQLTVEINKTLGLNKSKAFYIRIWNGHKERPHSTPENSE